MTPFLTPFFVFFYAFLCLCMFIKMCCKSSIYAALCLFYHFGCYKRMTGIEPQINGVFISYI
nr:MAG TPA: hypothetical protein [Caudoviricetes sp.]